MLMDSLADSGFGLLGRSNDPTIQKCIGSDLIFCYFCLVSYWRDKSKKEPAATLCDLNLFQPLIGIINIKFIEKLAQLAGASR